MEAEEKAEPVETETEYVFEGTTREDYINCSCAALTAISESNPMTKADTARQKDIKDKCLKIIAFYVDEMYSEIFEVDEDD